MSEIGIDLSAIPPSARASKESLTEALGEACSHSYLRDLPDAELTAFSYRGAEFLFHADPAFDRTVLVLGHPTAPAEARDMTYQRGYPLFDTVGGRRVDRGHFIPYTAGGSFGPNLYVQDRALNRGWSREGRQYRALDVLTRIVVDVRETSGVELELSSSPARPNGGLSCLTLTPG